MLFGFLREISEYEKRQTKKRNLYECVCVCIKHEIEGSTLPHPSNKHVTNTSTYIFIPLLLKQTHTHSSVRQEEKGSLKLFCLCTIFYTTQFVCVGWVFKNDAYLLWPTAQQRENKNHVHMTNCSAYTDTLTSLYMTVRKDTVHTQCLFGEWKEERGTE